ncbi:hypothetical protein B5F15_06490 [Butyricicoccus pullicaecorum]|uniref:Choice-of-anchor A domain-containing protein n=2 Tax=Butyricicoccus pullicaecorum TaxID=501571 RepID=A0A1Y4LR69_9FIRM|nr:hypothetical protein B5F15_06490 [Butyricicoccus pullicaecorum]
MNCMPRGIITFMEDKNMAINFGSAGEYNVFVFGNLSLSNTDAEGRVAVGGNATLSNYGVGASILPLPSSGSDASLVVNGDLDVSAGSNACGNTIVSPSSTVINYTMSNPNGSLLTATPIDFAEAERYLKCASIFWSGLVPNGTGTVVFGQLNLTGIDETLNIFRFDSTNIYGTGLALNQLNGINIIAPADSTILITVDGPNILYGSYQIFRNGIAASRTDAHKILWNHPDALTWSNSTTAIYGSVLAPFAAATTTFSQINGNIIFESFTGNAESHNELFTGELPEPTVCLLADATPTSSTTSTTSTTTTTTTTSTTTATTSTTTTTTAAINPRIQAVSDLFESIALQQAALSHILNAEGEKLQKVLSFDDIAPLTILLTNKSVESMVNAIANLETILKSKLDLFSDCICGDGN